MEYQKQTYGNKTYGITGNVGTGNSVNPTQHEGLPGRRLPEKSFRSGGINVSIWRNSAINKNGQPGEYMSVSLEKRYMDKNGVWQKSGSFRVTDLPKVALLVNKAYEFIVIKESHYDATGIVKDEEVLEEEIVM